MKQFNIQKQFDMQKQTDLRKQSDFLCEWSSTSAKVVTNQNGKVQQRHSNSEYRGCSVNLLGHEYAVFKMTKYLQSQGITGFCKMPIKTLFKKIRDSDRYAHYGPNACTPREICDLLVFNINDETSKSLVAVNRQPAGTIRLFRITQTNRVGGKTGALGEKDEYTMRLAPGDAVEFHFIGERGSGKATRDMHVEVKCGDSPTGWKNVWHPKRTL